jgi:hypothetical protein
MANKERKRTKTPLTSKVNQKKSIHSNNDDGLKAEVAAVAAELFGNDAGFDESDFRPERAQVMLGKADKRTEIQNNSDKKQHNLSKKQDAGDAKSTDSKPEKPYERKGDFGRAEKEPHDGSVKSRQWNAGVGPRPGDSHGVDACLLY